MSKEAYQNIAELEERVFKEARKLETLNSGPHTISYPRFIVLGNGPVDVFVPIVDLFHLERLETMSTITLRCPVVIRIHPFRSMAEPHCDVYVRRAKDDVETCFGESIDMSRVQDIAAQAQIAALEPELSIASIKNMDTEQVQRFYRRAKESFSHSEVIVELHGLRRPCIEIVALPGLRASEAGGERIKQIVVPYFKRDQVTFLVHLADQSLEHSRSLEFLNSHVDENLAGLIVKRYSHDRYHDTVKAELSKGAPSRKSIPDSSIDWYEPAICKFKIAQYIIQNTISRYVINPVPGSLRLISIVPKCFARWQESVDSDQSRET